MQDLKHQTSEKTILDTCAGLKRGERILFAFDSSDGGRIARLVAATGEIGAHCNITEIRGPITREPPSNVAQSMLENDVIFFCVNEERTLLWGHADAKLAAVEKGRRVLFLTQKIEETPTPFELRKIRDRSNKLGEILERTKKVTLLTEESKLEIELVGRRSLRLSSILSSPGSWGAVPDYAEAATAPLESGSNGTLRVNGMIVGIGKVDTPVDLEFMGGKLVRVSGGRAASEFETLLSKYDASARILCELGFGTNHLRSELRGEFDDKKALGTVHVALGDNHTFGGENRSNLHIDCLVTQPQIFLDGDRFELRSL